MGVIARKAQHVAAQRPLPDEAKPQPATSAGQRQRTDAHSVDPKAGKQGGKQMPAFVNERIEVDDRGHGQQDRQ